MPSGRYKLDENGNPVEVADLLEWAAWMDDHRHRVVASDTIESVFAKRTNELPDESAAELAGKVQVSTIFLGLDHNYSLEGSPILFETMIFGGPLDGYQTRYTSKEDAVTGHAEALRAAHAANVPIPTFGRKLDFDDDN